MRLAEAQDVVEEYAPAAYYKDNYRGWESDYLPAMCKVIDELPTAPIADDLPPPRALDVGPGWGTMMVWLAARGWEVSVIEYVQIGTHMTYDLLDFVGAEWVPLDICEKPLFGRQFDLITMTQVLPHLKWNPLAAVRHCKEMLAAGGTYIASVLDAKYYADKFEPPYGTDWRAVPSFGRGVAKKDAVTVMYAEQDFRELLSAVFDEVTVYQPEASTVLFGVRE